MKTKIALAVTLLALCGSGVWIVRGGWFLLWWLVGFKTW